MAKLSDKQKKFCREYLTDLNATQASIRSGYSKKTAKQMGTENLSKPAIQAEIERLMKKRSEKTEITQEMVLRELAHMAFDDIKNYLDFRTDTIKHDGVKEFRTYVDLKDSDQIDTRNISELTLGADGKLKFKLYSKENALQLLGRHLGMFKDKLEHSGEIKIEDPFANMSTEDLKKLIENE